MYYFVSFDPKEGAGRKQIVEAYNKFARHFEKKLSQFKLIGFYARNVLLGSRPHYVAIWEFSQLLPTWMNGIRYLQMTHRGGNSQRRSETWQPAGKLRLCQS
jgi:hypothetical protein